MPLTGVGAGVHPPTVQPGARSLQQAAQWYATLLDEAATAADREAWSAWLAEAPEHVAAWRCIETISRKFAPLRGDGVPRNAAARAGVEAARRAAPARRRALGGLAGAAAVGLSGWLAWRFTPLPRVLLALTADHRTGTGERRALVLDDGTRLWLNTDTAIKVDYRAQLRRVALLSGEILIETVSDPLRRPFLVDTAFGRLQALGTRFTVRQAGARTRLDVFDGTVEIRTIGGQLRRVHAGEATAFDARNVAPPEHAQQMREAWRRGCVPADNLPLGALLDELSRYRRGYISVAPEVAALKVIGVYPADDPDRALTMLAQALPIRVEHVLPWWITVSAR